MKINVPKFFHQFKPGRILGDIFNKIKIDIDRLMVLSGIFKGLRKQDKGLEHMGVKRHIRSIKYTVYSIELFQKLQEIAFLFLLLIKSPTISHQRDQKSNHNNDKDQYALWDVYPHSDFITYPSLYEGFGNAFLEAVYFKKPLLINRYANFVRDIEPKNFDLVVMDGYLTKRNVQAVKEILTSADLREKMVNHNYDVATRYYSYAVLRRWLGTIMVNFFGVE